MARAVLNYAGIVPATGQGFNPDQPIEGYYRFKLRRGAVPVGVRVWFGQPLDPVTREPLDRSLRWQAMVNDRDIDIGRVWPACADAPIDAQEYTYLASTEKWAREHASDAPQANPNQRINMLTAPTPF